MYCGNLGVIIDVDWQTAEVVKVSGEFRFETFVDVHSNIFREYLSEVLRLKNRLTDLEMQSVYYRGCYDSVGYLKKAGIL